MFSFGASRKVKTITVPWAKKKASVWVVGGYGGKVNLELNVSLLDLFACDLVEP